MTFKEKVFEYLQTNPVNDNEANKYKRLCNKFNLNIKQASEYWIDFKKKNRIINDINSIPPANYTKEEINKILTQTGSSLDITMNNVDHEVKTLEDLLDVCDVDEKEWYVISWQCKKWDLGIKNKDKEIEVKQLYSVSAKFGKRTIDNDVKLQKDVVLKELYDKAPEFSLKYDPLSNEKEFLYEISIPDLHIGKLAHHEESGEDYDIKIAVNRYKEAVSSLISNINIELIDRILLPIGNDMIQVDNNDSKTTAGTLVDTDSRFFKMVRAAKNLLIDTILQLSAIAPVDVVVIPGNHDRNSMLFIGEIIDAYFNKNKHVTVYNSPSTRKYYEYGNNGMLYTHGNNEKIADLGMIFAAENPKLWSNTLFRFVKLGHLHHNKKINYLYTQDFQGFQIQVLPSLSNNDSWHHNKGYISLKQAKGFLYHKKNGLVGEFTFTVV